MLYVKKERSGSVNGRNCPVGLVFLKFVVLTVKATNYCTTPVNNMSVSRVYAPYGS